MTPTPYLLRGIIDLLNIGSEQTPWCWTSCWAEPRNQAEITRFHTRMLAQAGGGLGRETKRGAIKYICLNHILPMDKGWKRRLLPLRDRKAAILTTIIKLSWNKPDFSMQHIVLGRRCVLNFQDSISVDQEHEHALKQLQTEIQRGRKGTHAVHYAISTEFTMYYTLPILWCESGFLTK